MNGGEGDRVGRIARITTGNKVRWGRQWRKNEYVSSEGRWVMANEQETDEVGKEEGENRQRKKWG